jgi:hypothetical protein
MTNTLPFDLEAEISALLDELSSAQSDLLEVLALKRQALASADVAAMANLQTREVDLTNRLSHCQERRTELLAEANRQGMPGNNVAKLAGRANSAKSGALARRVKDAAARMRLLNHESLANWVLAQRSLLHVSQLLEIIATGGRLQPTYGDKESAQACGSLVNQQA